MAKKTVNVIYKVDDKELLRLKTALGLSEQQAKKLSDELKNVDAQAKKAGQDGTKSFMDFKNVAASITVAGLAVAIGSIAKKIFDLGVAQEQTNIAFTTFLGSGEKAKKLIAELTKFSIITPFTPDQVNKAAKTLLAFGVQANEIVPTLKLLGDVASGTGKDLGEMAVIFGQIKSTGRLMGQDLLQLINAGFNPLQVISQKTGRSMRDLKKDMENGLISFEMVNDAFKTATSEGGLFFNLMEKQSASIGGLMSTIEGNIEEIGKKLFSARQGGLADFTKGVAEATANTDAWAEALNGVIDQAVAPIQLLFNLIKATNKAATDYAKNNDRLRKEEIRFQLELLKIDYEFARSQARKVEITKKIIELTAQLGEKMPTTEDPLPWANDVKNQTVEETAGLVEDLRTKIKKLNEEIENSTNRKDLGATGALILQLKKYQAELDTLLGKETAGEKESEKRRKEALENTRKHLKESYEKRKKDGDEAAARQRENDKRSFEHWKYYKDLEVRKTQEAEDEKLEIEEDNAAKKRDMEQSLYENSIMVARSLADFLFQTSESQLGAIRDRYQEEIELAGDNEQAKKAIEFKRERDLKAAQAREKAEYKVQAIKKALAETAINIVEAYPDPYRMAGAVILGGIQIANIQRLKEGGWVKGPGGEKDDRVPIMASPNEFMVNAASARKAPRLLEAINEKRIDDKILRGASDNRGSFNDARLVSELRAVRDKMDSLRGPDLVEVNGTLYKAISKGNNYRKLVKASI